jgi:hypothetical protein
MPSKGTFLPTIAFAIGLTGITFAPLRAQSLNARSTSTQPAAAPTPDWEIAAGGKMAFDTATVRQNTTAPPKARSSTFPLGPGDVYISRGGFFGARNFPLYLYIFFAYKVTDNQEQFLDDQLPKWALTDRFDIEARKEGNPTKDQMRLMVRSLLADRAVSGDADAAQPAAAWPAAGARCPVSGHVRRVCGYGAERTGPYTSRCTRSLDRIHCQFVDRGIGRAGSPDLGPNRSHRQIRRCRRVGASDQWFVAAWA